jgi:hypothetical protein
LGALGQGPQQQLNKAEVPLRAVENALHEITARVASVHNQHPAPLRAQPRGKLAQHERLAEVRGAHKKRKLALALAHDCTQRAHCVYAVVELVAANVVGRRAPHVGDVRLGRHAQRRRV